MSSRLPDSRDIKYAFDCLPVRAPLCRYLVGMHVYHANPGTWYVQNIAKLPLAFVSAVLERYIQHHYLQGSLKLCDYHEHKNTEEKRACDMLWKKKMSSGALENYKLDDKGEIPDL